MGDKLTREEEEGDAARDDGDEGKAKCLHNQDVTGSGAFITRYFCMMSFWGFDALNSPSNEGIMGDIVSCLVFDILDNKKEPPEQPPPLADKLMKLLICSKSSVKSLRTVRGI